MEGIVTNNDELLKNSYIPNRLRNQIIQIGESGFPDYY